MTRIRMDLFELEEPRDKDAVHRLNLVAFENGPEVALMVALRASCREYLSFVAVEDGAVIGHILFTPRENQLSFHENMMRTNLPWLTEPWALTGGRCPG